MRKMLSKKSKERKMCWKDFLNPIDRFNLKCFLFAVTVCFIFGMIFVFGSICWR